VHFVGLFLSSILSVNCYRVCFVQFW